VTEGSHPAHGGASGATTAAEARVAARLEEALGALSADHRHGRTVSALARARLHAVCAEARELDVRPARVLVLLKEAWRAVQCRADLAAWQRSEAALERLVTFCIAAYYTPGPPAPAPDLRLPPDDAGAAARP
jgi:hypothetical protein